MLRSWVIYILSLLGAVAFFLFYKMFHFPFVILNIILINVLFYNKFLIFLNHFLHKDNKF